MIESPFSYTTLTPIYKKLDHFFIYESGCLNNAYTIRPKRNKFGYFSDYEINKYFSSNYELKVLKQIIKLAREYNFTVKVSDCKTKIFIIK